MISKTWHFLLPGTGTHVLKAEVGGPPESWRICMDGVDRPYHPSQANCIVNSDEICFDGPDGCTLNIRRKGHDEYKLIVNGSVLEELSPKKNNSLRDFNL